MFASYLVNSCKSTSAMIVEKVFGLTLNTVTQWGINQTTFKTWQFNLAMQGMIIITMIILVKHTVPNMLQKLLIKLLVI